MKKLAEVSRTALVAGLLAGAALVFVLGVLIGRSSAPAQDGGSGVQKSEEATTWTCSMHPQIKLPEPGKCPICGMDLIPLKTGQDDSAPRVLKLSPAAVALAEIETQPVLRRPAIRQVRMVGKVGYDETRVKRITAWVPGRLDRLYVDYTGTLVRKGDHLVSIYSPELLYTQEELLQAVEALARPARDKLLRESDERRLESARRKLRLWGLSAKQIAAIERTKKASDHITIYAPMGGVVIHKRKEIGDYVKTGEGIYTIADLSKVWVKLDAYESDVPWIRYGQTVSFETEAYPGETFKGRIVFVDPVLNPRTRTLKVRLNIDNKDGRLKPEMFVRAVLRAPLGNEGQTMDPSLKGKWICPMHGEEIKAAAGTCPQCGMDLVPADTIHAIGDTKPSPSLLVPASAVLWTGTRSLVYVRLEGKQPAFEGREVELGPRAGAHYVIRKGLEVGEMVVTQGAFKIDSALQIEARPSMMLSPLGQTKRLAAPKGMLLGLTPVLQAYLSTQEGLAKDDLEAGKAGFSSLGKALAAVKASNLTGEVLDVWLARAKEAREAAAAGGESGDLDAARIAFRLLSRAVLLLQKSFGHLEGKLYEIRCPMAFNKAGASWLQLGRQVRNPYLGTSMPGCGEVEGELTLAASAAPYRQTAPPSFLEGLGPVFQAYLAVQRGLAGDDQKAAQAGLGKLSTALSGAKAKGLQGKARRVWSVLRKKLNGLVKRASASADLSGLRTVFGSLSEAVIELEERFGHSTGTLYQVFCPMAFDNAGASWLQDRKQVKNPYYGAAMLPCGEVKRTLGPIRGPASRSTSKPIKKKPPKHEHGKTKHEHGKTKHEPKKTKHEKTRHEKTKRAAANSPADARRSFRSGLRAVWRGYLVVHAALAGDDDKAASAALAPLGRAVKALNGRDLPKVERGAASTSKRGLARGLSEMRKAKGIAARRNAFERVSRSLIPLIRRFGLGAGNVARVFHCPMAFGNKGGSWLQATRKTKNPYYGASMLTCGRQDEVIPVEGKGRGR